MKTCFFRTPKTEASIFGSRSFCAFICFHCLLFSNVLNGVETFDDDASLPIALETESDGSSERERHNAILFQSARSALDNGLASVAEAIITSVLSSEETLDPDLVLDLKGTLFLSLLNQGKIQEVEAMIDELVDHKDFPVFDLFLTYYTENDVSVLEEKLSVLLDEEITRTNPWVVLLEGIVTYRKGDFLEANSYFERALALAVNSYQENQFEILIWREELMSGAGEESLVISLEMEIERTVNPTVRSQLTQQLAIALVSLDRRREAIDALELQLSLLGSDDRAQKDRLLMMIALLSERQSGKAKVVLEEILREGSSARLREMAFYSWVSAIDFESGDDFSMIEALLLSRPNDELRNHFLYVHSLKRFFEGDFEGSKVALNQLIEVESTDAIQSSALRLMVGICWSQTPAQYRLAAEHLLRLIQLETDEREKFRLRRYIADSYFLNNDFENALPYYQQVLSDDQISSENRDKVMFNLTTCHLQMGNVDAAKMVLDGIYSQQPALHELIWASEWNLNQYLVAGGRIDEAIERLEALKFNEASDETGGWFKESKLRRQWLLSFLYLRKNQFLVCLDSCEAALETEDQHDGENDQIAALFGELKLLKARALLALDEKTQAFAVFQSIRATALPETAAASYVFQARYHWNSGELLEAQDALVTLADRYPNSQYAPVALYEAAVNAEQQRQENSDQEAIALFERIATEFPEHPLNFISRLKQGDLLRRSNQFQLAVPFYENLLEEFAGDARLHLIEIALAESYLALGSSRREYTEEGIRIFERLADLNSIPVEVRIESAVKASAGLDKLGRGFRAEEMIWRAVGMIRSEQLDSVVLESTGRYWLARGILMLGEKLSERGQNLELYRLIDLAESMNLSGIELLRSHL